MTDSEQDKEGGAPPPNDAQARKKAKLAAALRANLQRRKAHDRALRDKNDRAERPATTNKQDS